MDSRLSGNDLEFPVKKLVSAYVGWALLPVHDVGKACPTYNSIYRILLDPTSFLLGKNFMDLEVIAVILSPILVFGPFVFAIFILKKLDTAAKQRREIFGKSKFRFMIVDFLSLILLLQMPFSLLGLDLRLGDQVLVFLISLALLALTLVWLTTIKTVSQAGIVTFGWRALISMVLIPTMYIGSFFCGVPAVQLLWGERVSNAEIVWMVAAAVGMILSPWIVRGALNSVSLDDSIASQPAAPADPFAD